MKKILLAFTMATVVSASVVTTDLCATTLTNCNTEAAMPAPNDGRYMRTQHSVTIYSETGVCKGTYSVYLYHGQKYIDFNNSWVCIQGKSRFCYCAVWYIIK